jgi:hypothetical protein
MFIFVLICNGLIVIFNCYLVWKLLQLRKALKQFANTLEKLEKKTPLFLKLTFLNFRQREYQSLVFRQKYAALKQKWQKLIMLVQLLNWLYRTYRSCGSYSIDNRGIMGDNRE